MWITCGSLVGSGEVQANGANKSSYYNTGCGGRVAVYQTTATDFDGFNAGKVTAYGGVTTGVAGAYPERPVGTVYLQSAGEEDRCGTVFVRLGPELWYLPGHGRRRQSRQDRLGAVRADDHGEVTNGRDARSTYASVPALLADLI